MAGANDYVRAIDFTQPASRATWTNYAVPVTGGAAALTPGPAEHHAPEHGVGAAARDLDHPVGIPERRGREQGNRAPGEALSGGHVRRADEVAQRKALQGGRLHQQYNMVEKVQTWLENPIFGDMLVETEYTHYREGANGLKFPAQIVQKRGGWPTFTAYILGAHANPANLQQLLTPPAGGRGGAPGGAPAGAAGPDLGKAGRRRLPHQRRVQRAGDRVRGSHPALRARTAERSARAGRSSPKPRR